MNDLLNKVITVSAKEEKLAGGKPVMKIKDEKGLSYSVWKFKQDGTESVAWGQIPDLNTPTQIGYVEEVKQHPEHGSITYRTIRNFNPDLANAIIKEETPNSGANNSSQGKPRDNFLEEKSPKFWDMKAYKQCLWADWLKTGEWRPDIVWQVFKDIEQDAKKRFFIYSEKEEPIPDELPIIQTQEDMSYPEGMSEEERKFVDEVPF